MSAAEGDAAAVAGQLAELKVLAAEFRQAVRDHTAAVVAYEQRLAANRSLDEQFAMHEASLALLERRLGALEAGEGPRSGGGAAAEGPRLTAGALAAAPASRSSALAAEVEANTPKGGDGGGGGGAAAAPAGAAADPGAPTSPGSAKGRASKARGR